MLLLYSNFLENPLGVEGKIINIVVLKLIPIKCAACNRMTSDDFVVLNVIAFPMPIYEH